MGNGNWDAPSSSHGVPSWGLGRAQENNQGSSIDSNGNNICPSVDFESSLNPLSAIFSPSPAAASSSSLPSQDRDPFFLTPAWLDTVASDLLAITQEGSLSPDPEAFSYDYLENIFDQPQNHSPTIDDWFDNLVPHLPPISEFQADLTPASDGGIAPVPPSLISVATAVASTSGSGSTAHLPPLPPSRKVNQRAARAVTFRQSFPVPPLATGVWSANQFGSTGASRPSPIYLSPPSSGGSILPRPSLLPSVTTSTSTSEATARLHPLPPVRKVNQPVAGGLTYPQLYPAPSLGTGVWSTDQPGPNAANGPPSILPPSGRGTTTVLPRPSLPPQTSLLSSTTTNTRISEATGQLFPLSPAKRANEPAMTSGFTVLPFPSRFPALTSSLLPKATATTRTSEATTRPSPLPPAKRANEVAAASGATVLPLSSILPPVERANEGATTSGAIVLPLPSSLPPSNSTTSTSEATTRMSPNPPAKRVNELPTAASGTTFPPPSLVPPPAIPSPPSSLHVVVDQPATSEATLTTPIFSPPWVSNAIATSSLAQLSKSTRRRAPGKSSCGGLTTRPQPTSTRQQSTADEPDPPLPEGQALVVPSSSSAVETITSKTVRKRKAASSYHLNNDAGTTRELDYSKWKSVQSLTFTAEAGEDISAKILSMAKGRVISIVTASGFISSVELQKPNTLESAASFQGRFGILSLSGTLSFSERRNTSSSVGHLTISLAGEDGGVRAGVVMGPLIAASTVQIRGCIYTPPASGGTPLKPIEQVIKEQVQQQVASMKVELLAQMEEQVKREMQEWKAQMDEKMKRETQERKAHIDEQMLETHMFWQSGDHPKDAEP